MAVHALRGATQLDIDERDHLLDRVAELVRELMDRNGLNPENVISIVFTATADIRSEFPAYAARAIGIADVPLLCAQELEVVGAMPRVVRLLAHAEMDVPRELIRHVYLHGARELRTDLPR
ncbi:MAG TPA: chorismate mutase [Jiangellaceae bacterium]